MSVEDWAREQAEKKHPTPGPVDWNVGASVAVERNNFADGIVHAFSALLSDEAVEAAADRISDATEPGNWSMVARAALQAAIAAVTEGDTVIIEAPMDVSERVQRGVVGGVSIAEGETE